MSIEQAKRHFDDLFGDFVEWSRGDKRLSDPDQTVDDIYALVDAHAEAARADERARIAKDLRERAQRIEHMDYHGAAELRCAADDLEGGSL